MIQSLSFFCAIYLKSFLNYEVSLISSVAKSFFDVMLTDLPFTKNSSTLKFGVLL